MDYSRLFFFGEHSIGLLLTQQAGRIAFELGYAGVFYRSRYGHSIENWAIFEDWAISERFPIHQPNSLKVAEDDPDLLEALRILGLIIIG